MTKAETIINLIRYGELLKNVDRSGWVLASLQTERIESVAEHSFGSILSSIAIAQHLKSNEVEINIERVILMAALHDLPESITGDIARTQDFVKDKALVKAKNDAEVKAIQTILEPLGESFSSLHKIWNEFDIGDSLESRVVRGADIIDMLIHTRSLEEAGASPQTLHQFFTSSRSEIKSIEIEIVTEIYDALYQEHILIAKEQNINLEQT